MNQKEKFRLRKLYEEEMSPDELIEMASYDFKEYGEGIYELLKEAIKKRGLENSLKLEQKRRQKEEKVENINCSIKGYAIFIALIFFWINVVYFGILAISPIPCCENNAEAAWVAKHYSFHTKGFFVSLVCLIIINFLNTTYKETRLKIKQVKEE